MGNNVQKVLQGRGDKKRQGFRIKTVFPFLFLFFAYLGLLFEFPVKNTVLWFLLSAATVLLCACLHFLSKEKDYSVEFIFSLALPITGTATAFAMPWLRMAYFPFMIALTAFYGQRTIISILILIPFLELNNIIRTRTPLEEIVFFSSLVLTAGISLFIKKKMKKRTGGFFSNATKGTDRFSDTEAEMRSSGDQEVIDHYLELMFRPDGEIKDILTVAKNSIFADSVNLFLNSGGNLRLRCSTDEPEGIILSDGGLIDHCFKEKKPVVAFDLNEKKLEAGYIKEDRISSLVAVPVVDGNFPLGVMSADSARFRAFSSADSDVLRMFSNQILRILQRERIYPQIHRSYESLKILNEESSKLLSSLHMDVIVKNLIDGAYRIAPSDIAFFHVKGKEAELVDQKGLPSHEKKSFNLKGTVLEIAAKNKENRNLSDVRDYRSPVLPFKVSNISSVFFLPLLYEKDLLGMLVLLSEKTNAFSPYQIGLLEVLGNQASTSIANAKFHAEIERMAITDGLTGLFNHRHFQEKLSQEFRRQERFSEPMSLLLIDIDYFKKVNDTYGHPVGDSVLKGVADKIGKTVRNIDIPARYGGEEFAIVLLGTDAKGALNMAERLRKTISGTNFSDDGKTFTVTVSIGISTYPDGIKAKEEFIERADKALYHAKRNGRNRSVIWSEIAEQTV